MGKLLRLRDYILISAALGGEIFEEVRLVGGFLPKAMMNQYGFVPPGYKKSSYLSRVSEMLSVGDIERKTDSKGENYLILTSLGKNKYKRMFRLFKDQSKWDGYFMIVIFDISEKKRGVRDTLRRKLEELGFGMLQESVWISPYHFEEDLREFLVNHNLGRDAFVLSAKKILAGNIFKIVEKVWGLKEINKSYKKVISKINEAKNSRPTNKKRLIEEAYKLYLKTLSRDPILPSKLLPKNWYRKKALKLLNKYLNISNRKAHTLVD